MEKPYIWHMKTTLNVREDLYRKAKAQAALQGISLSRFFEESLERMLQASSVRGVPLTEWAADLPTLSEQAVQDLKNALSAPDFRTIDREMWE